MLTYGADEGNSDKVAEKSENMVGKALVEGKKEEAESEGAFNEETGEVNWDCPVRLFLALCYYLLTYGVKCLGGMADGPCGEQFKSAFSCFVFSEADPKGMDCVEKFKGMQDCFREHPDIYGEGMFLLLPQILLAAHILPPAPFRLTSNPSPHLPFSHEVSAREADGGRNRRRR